MFTSIVVLCVLCVIAAVSMVVLLWKHYEMLDEIDILNDECESFSSEMDELSNNYEAIITQKEHDQANFMDWAKQQIDELKANHEAEIKALNKQHDDYLFQSTGIGCGSVGSQSIYPKDDDTRDLPAVDSEFTLPKVDDETLLYRGLMGSAEMEFTLQSMIERDSDKFADQAYEWRLVHHGGEFIESDRTGFFMLRDNGWLDMFIPTSKDVFVAGYKPSKALLERICTRPELAAKIGKGAK